MHALTVAIAAVFYICANGVTLGTSKSKGDIVNMSAEAVTTLFVIAVFFVAVLSGRLAVDIALAVAMVALLVTGVLSPFEALQGFANPGDLYYRLFLYCLGGN